MGHGGGKSARRSERPFKSSLELLASLGGAIPLHMGLLTRGLGGRQFVSGDHWRDRSNCEAHGHGDS